jgi:glucose-1-phosphate thymidylyltransferase
MSEDFSRTKGFSGPLVALIPAAGKGSRLAPFPCPKELFPVGYQDIKVNGEYQKRPKVVSQYLIENLVEAGTDKIFIILGDGKADIMSYYGDGTRFGVDIAYLFQEQLDGMPGALALASPWVDDATVLFGMPDTIIEPKNVFQKLLMRHRQSSADLTLGLFQTDTPEKFGVVELDSNEAVVCTIDKPENTELTLMWGCACWSPKFTQLLSEYVSSVSYDGKEAILGDVFNLAIKEGLIVQSCTFLDGQYMDIGTADELDLALKRFHL